MMAFLNYRLLPFVVLYAVPFLLPDLARAQDIDFGLDVPPILSDASFHYHGTDPSTREADLRPGYRRRFVRRG